MRNARISALTWLAMSLTALVCTPTAYGQTTRVVGSIVSIHGNAVRIKSDTGAEIGAMVDATTRLLRTAPGERDLKSATPVALSDLQPGDRVLIIANGTAGQLTASTIVVMRASDIAEKRERETDDWQKRGIGGLVSSVDVARCDPDLGTVLRRQRTGGHPHHPEYDFSTLRP